MAVMNLMTIDGGTTNTRIYLFREGEIVASSRLPIGVRDAAMAGKKDGLINEVRKAIENLLKESKIEYRDIRLVVASGMITSNLGILEVPHITAPVAIDDLIKFSRYLVLPEFFDLPFLFVPGVKNRKPSWADSKSDDLIEAMDMMRGEETETFGIMELRGLKGPAVLILAGSHIKIVKVDEWGRIDSSVTTMGGELFSTISRNTILANSIPPELVTKAEREQLLRGARISERVGFGRGCFVTRVMDLLGDTEGNDRANFLLGAVIGQDIYAMKNSQALKVNPTDTIVISGPGPLREAFYILLTADPYFAGRIIMLEDEEVRYSVPVGARKIGMGFLEMQKRRGGDREQNLSVPD
nr:MAG: 2-dehydro-3-deoxygalactonokinase [Bacillota bacterium]